MGWTCSPAWVSAAAWTGADDARTSFAGNREQSNAFELPSESKLDEVNIWIERFWRSLKRECVYLNPVDTVCQMRSEIAKYIEYYNTERPHQGIDNHTPLELCPEKIINKIRNKRQNVA